jgi:hypothetical protein
MMGNPYCDQFMFLFLKDKLTATDLRIKELTPQLNTNKV